jgi:hypothetical protein
LSQSQEFWQELRKLKSKKRQNSSKGSVECFSHFKLVFSGDNNFCNENVENDLSNENTVEKLDILFTVEEV